MASPFPSLSPSLAPCPQSTSRHRRRPPSTPAASSQWTPPHRPTPMHAGAPIPTPAPTPTRRSSGFLGPAGAAGLRYPPRAPPLPSGPLHSLTRLTARHLLPLRPPGRCLEAVRWSAAQERKAHMHDPTGLRLQRQSRSVRWCLA
uniref:Uncharacterized protein n=1 Tax=Setaria viridis TaxID=4556 RepID=A0A4U6UGJ9_SETVI|nr:hypothetical protein SEVIR_5G222450v2 [Setaria viridis]